MLAVKAVFDGSKIVLPERLGNVAPGEVIVIFEAPSNIDQETAEWMKLQEESFAKAWDNDEDSVYDAL
jgi:hypothetical protein